MGSSSKGKREALLSKAVSYGGRFFFEVTSRAFFPFKLGNDPEREEIEPALLGTSLTALGEVPRSIFRFSTVAVARSSD